MDQWVYSSSVTLHKVQLVYVKQLQTLKDAITIIGGGDSAAAAISLGFENDSHIFQLVAERH